jgi:hypothetical protein
MLSLPQVGGLPGCHWLDSGSSRLPAQLRRSWLVLTVLMCYFVVRFMLVANSESVAPHELKGLLANLECLLVWEEIRRYQKCQRDLRELFHDIRVRHPKVNPSINSKICVKGPLGCICIYQ